MKQECNVFVTGFQKVKLFTLPLHTGDFLQNLDRRSDIGNL